MEAPHESQPKIQKFKDLQRPNNQHDNQIATDSWSTINRVWVNQKQTYSEQTTNKLTDTKDKISSESDQEENIYLNFSRRKTVRPQTWNIYRTQRARIKLQNR